MKNIKNYLEFSIENIYKTKKNLENFRKFLEIFLENLENLENFVEILENLLENLEKFRKINSYFVLN